MERIIGYVPISVGPSKLDQVLAYCPELCNVSKEKICIILDIVKLGKLLEYPVLTGEQFYDFYEMPLPILERVQHTLQAEFNTKRYYARVGSLKF